MAGRTRVVSGWRAGIALGIGLLVWWFRPTPIEREPPRADPRAGAQVSTPVRGFSSQAELEEHFTKHGREFPGATITTYLRLAQTLRDAPLSATVIEVIQPDGDIARFDRTSGAFLVFDNRGTIRTFFRPRDGERYFRRQGRRAAS